MHSFFCDTIGDAASRPSLEEREYDHLFRTLRARPGDEIRLLDGRGGVALARVLPGREVEILQSETVPEPRRRIHLYTAVPRKAKFDTLLKQAAELGVSVIAPVECERSVALPEGSSRWVTLLQEGCKQSGNPFLPEVRPPVPLAAALAELRENGTAVFFGAVPQSGAVSGRKPPETGDFAWLVGPEGGFTDAEEQMLLDAGAFGVNLGPYILRLETAAVCGVALLRQRMAEQS